MGRTMGRHQRMKGRACHLADSSFLAGRTQCTKQPWPQKRILNFSFYESCVYESSENERFMVVHSHLRLPACALHRKVMTC
jgi:hypothetical protein